MIIFVSYSAGLGDALGVDWASLVEDVRRREHVASTGGARDRWRPERVLTRLGLSVEMAGKATVQSILDKNASASNKQGHHERANEANGDVETFTRNSNNDEKSDYIQDVNALHPVAAVQVRVLLVVNILVC